MYKNAERVCDEKRRLLLVDVIKISFFLTIFYFMDFYV